MDNKYCVVCNEQLYGQKQKYCSNKCKQKGHYDKIKQQTNTYHSQTLRALSRKLELIKDMGGGCNKCGYNANISALHFHHRNSTEKSFKLGSRILANKSYKSILEEAAKCDLLCANCHAEEHNPELTIENVYKIIQGASRQK